MTQSTEVASTSDGPWVALGTLQAVLRVAPDGARVFERDNLRGGAALRVEDMIAAANRPPAIRSVEPVAAPAVASAAHDVPSLLALNLHVEKLHGQDKLKPLRPKTSRRRHDYFVLLSLIGALIFVVLLVESFVGVQLQVLAAKMPDQLWPIFRLVVFHSPIFAWGLAAFFFYAFALGWLMFWVMDDY